MDNPLQDVVDGLAKHFGDLVGFAAKERDRLTGALTSVEALGQRVETEVLGKLADFEDTIRAKVIADVTATFQPMIDDLGAKIDALTKDAPAPALADTVSGATSAAPVTDPASVIAGQTGATTAIAQAAIDAHAEASAAGVDPVAHATDAAVGAGADPVTAANVAQAVQASADAGVAVAGA